MNASVYLALTIVNRPGFSVVRWILFTVAVVATMLTKFAVAPFLGVLAVFVVGHQLVTDRRSVVPATRTFLRANGRRRVRNLALLRVCSCCQLWRARSSASG